MTEIDVRVLRGMAKVCLEEELSLEEWEQRIAGFRAVANPATVLALCDALEAAARLREAANNMTMAYAGEMAAKAAGVLIQGFPLLDAYQALMLLLVEPELEALGGEA